MIIKSKIGMPIYRQIISYIEEGIESGELKKGDRLPSINKVKNDHHLSRDTVLMAFNDLKNRGIIKSVVGKGYYVSNEDIKVSQKIFLLFDELNAFKEDLFNAIIENLGENIQVDIFFHHFNKEIFSKLIYDNIGNYNYYVIMPANMDSTGFDIQNLPNDKVYILDQIHDDLLEYSAIFQNFDKAICNNMTKVLDLIRKYKKIVLVFDEIKQPKGLRNGFLRFCEVNNFSYEIIGTLKDRQLEKRALYVLLDDFNLLTLIKKAKELNYALAKEIGVISYNDTLLKEIVANGITTISTDFNVMGKRLAAMILNKEKVQLENPINLLLRNSF